MWYQDGERRPFLVVGEGDAEVGHELGAQGDIDTLNRSETTGHFRSTATVAFTELILL